MNGEINRFAGLNFLLTEIETGLTFARIAQKAKAAGGSKFERNLKNAQKAYESAAQFRRRVELDGEQKATVDANLQQLKALLETVGEVE